MLVDRRRDHLIWHVADIRETAAQRGITSTEEKRAPHIDGDSRPITNWASGALAQIDSEIPLVTRAVFISARVHGRSIG